MEKISASDFQQWRENNVTRAFFNAAQHRIYDAVYSLSVSAGQDAIQDNFTRGFIAAYRELENFRIDDLEEQAVE